MYVTLSGIVITVKFSKSNAVFPILVTLYGITVVMHPRISVLLSVSIIALQLSRLSYIGFLSSTVMLVRFEQP